MAKFKCININCVFFDVEKEIPEYYVQMKYNNLQFLDKNKIQICCPDCDKPLVRMQNEFNGFCTNFDSFNSKTPLEKREMLKKRANQYFKENKEGMKDYRDAVDKDEV